MSTEWIKENWKFVAISLVALFIVSIFGYSIYRSAIQPKEGTVVRKDYYPAYTSTDYNTVTGSDGKTIRIPVQKYHSERYQIVIQGINAKGEEDFGYYDVTMNEYENIEIGDYYIKQRVEE